MSFICDDVWKNLVNCKVVLKVPEEGELPGGHKTRGAGGALRGGVGSPAWNGWSLRADTPTCTCVGACTHVYTARRRGPQPVGGWLNPAACRWLPAIAEGGRERSTQGNCSPPPHSATKGVWGHRVGLPLPGPEKT